MEPHGASARKGSIPLNVNPQTTFRAGNCVRGKSEHIRYNLGHSGAFDLGGRICIIWRKQLENIHSVGHEKLCRRIRKNTIKRKEGQWRVKSVRKNVLEVERCSLKENKHDIRQWFRRVQPWEGCVGLRRWPSAYPSVSAGTQVTLLVGNWIFPPPALLVKVRNISREFPLSGSFCSVPGLNLLGSY